MKEKLLQIRALVDELLKAIDAEQKPIKFTREKFMSFYGVALDPQICYDALRKALEADGILSDKVLIGALATAHVEVGRTFRPVEEMASGAAYEGRLDLGNTQAGDGPRFKGRGYIQITGRANYTNYGKIFGVDLLSDPKLALGTELAAKILSRYFKDRKIDVACNSGDWEKVRKQINGGTNGLLEFLRVVGEYSALIQ